MSDTINKTRWFWAWEDDKEEAWLEAMSASGWHLSQVKLPCSYTFEKGEAQPYNYRLDYLYSDKKTLPEYIQVFQDAGWEYVGEMSNWRYWRKPSGEGEPQEIFTDNESKIKKYQRVLTYLGFFLVILVALGVNVFSGNVPYADQWTPITTIYNIIRLIYGLVIPIYIIAVVKLLQRIRQLRRDTL